MRSFWSDEEGNFLLLFAFAMIPIIGSMGVALDYSLASSYRTDIQKALDATALALTRIMPADQATLDTVGDQYFQANLGPHQILDLQLTVTPELGKLKLSAKGRYKPQLAHLIGVHDVDLGTKSEARWSIGKVEIALVLDNSLSMQDFGRMGHLKAAAHDLLNVLETAAKNPGDAKVAIVPFDGMVRVPTSSPVPTWIKWDYWDSTFTSQQCSGSGKTKTCTTVIDPHSEWAGCVYDRDMNTGATPAVNNDTLDSEPTAAPTYFPATKCYNNSTTLQRVLSLTENWTTLHTKVTNMTPTGYTNINLGLNWGWHVLSSTPLFTEGVAYNTENLTKYIILMTDGNNTRSRYYTCPIEGPCSTIDARTALTCANIKTAGIKIYTIRLVSGNAALLSACATNPGMYYDVQDSSQLSAVFSSIGAEIANLHLAK